MLQDARQCHEVCFHSYCLYPNWKSFKHSGMVNGMNFTTESFQPEFFGFDIDGVVADTMGSFIRIARREYGIEGLRREDITSYWLERCLPVPEKIVWAIVERLIADPFGSGLQPISGARKGLLAFGSHGPLTFVTARPEKDSIERWLMDLLPEISRNDIRVVATGEHSKKADALKERGLRFFVEDHLETCRYLWENGIGAIVYDQPWNRDFTPFKRAHSWEEITRIACLES